MQEEHLFVRAVVGPLCDAVRRSQRYVQGPQRLLDALPDDRGVVCGRPGKHQSELVSPDPAGDVHRAARLGDRPGDPAQDLVSFGVTGLVVDELESVQVEEQHAEACPSPLRALDLTLYGLVELAVVQQLGQRVLLRELLQPVHEARVGERGSCLRRVRLDHDRVVRQEGPRSVPERHQRAKCLALEEERGSTQRADRHALVLRQLGEAVDRRSSSIVRGALNTRGVRSAHAPGPGAGRAAGPSCSRGRIGLVANQESELLSSDRGLCVCGDLVEDVLDPQLRDEVPQRCRQAVGRLSLLVELQLEAAGLPAKLRVVTIGERRRCDRGNRNRSRQEFWRKERRGSTVAAAVAPATARVTFQPEEDSQLMSYTHAPAPSTAQWSCSISAFAMPNISGTHDSRPRLYWQSTR